VAAVYYPGAYLHRVLPAGNVGDLDVAQAVTIAGAHVVT
jgi:hypothetical protein